MLLRAGLSCRLGWQEELVPLRANADVNADVEVLEVGLNNACDRVLEGELAAVRAQLAAEKKRSKDQFNMWSAALQST